MDLAEETEEFDVVLKNITVSFCNGNIYEIRFDVEKDGSVVQKGVMSGFGPLVDYLKAPHLDPSECYNVYYGLEKSRNGWKVSDEFICADNYKLSIGQFDYAYEYIYFKDYISRWLYAPELGWIMKPDSNIFTFGIIWKMPTICPRCIR